MSRAMVVARNALLLALFLALIVAGLLALLGVSAGQFLATLAGTPGNYVVGNVVAGAVVLGVAGGVLGSLAVTRGQSLLGDAVSHAALPGIFLVFMLWGAAGLEGVRVAGLTLPAARSLVVVLVGALVAGLLATGLILVIARYTRLKADAALGLTLASFFGLGIVLRSLLQNHPARFGNRAGLEAFLVGTAATITRSDVLVMALLAGVAVATVVLLWKELKLLAFDPDFLGTQGFPVRALDLLLTALIVVSVLVGLQMVGVVLMSAMLIAPAAAARQWTDDFAGMTVLAVVLAVASGVTGVLLSAVRPGVATGPLIAVTVSGLALASVLAAPGRGLLWQALTQLGLRRQVSIDALLLHVAQQQARGGATDLASLATQLGWAPGRLQGIARRASAAGQADIRADRLALTPAGEDRVRALLADIGAPAMELAG